MILDDSLLWGYFLSLCLWRKIRQPRKPVKCGEAKASREPDPKTQNNLKKFSLNMCYLTVYPNDSKSWLHVLMYCGVAIPAKPIRAHPKTIPKTIPSGRFVQGAATAKPIGAHPCPPYLRMSLRHVPKFFRNSYAHDRERLLNFTWISIWYSSATISRGVMLKSLPASLISVPKIPKI